MPSVKLGVTVKPPETALSSVTVKVIESPSLAEASAIVTAGVAGVPLAGVTVISKKAAVSASFTASFAVIVTV